MSLIYRINTMSEEEVIKALQDNGIQVIMKPVALLPMNLAEFDNMQPIGVIQTDIYTALEKIENRKKIIGDPFS